MQTLVEGCKGEKSPEEKLERLGLHLRDSYEVRMERNWEVIIYTKKRVLGGWGLLGVTEKWVGGCFLWLWEGGFWIERHMQRRRKEERSGERERAVHTWSPPNNRLHVSQKWRERKGRGVSTAQYVFAGLWCHVPCAASHQMITWSHALLLTKCVCEQGQGLVLVSYFESMDTPCTESCDGHASHGGHSFLLPPRRFRQKYNNFKKYSLIFSLKLNFQGTKVISPLATKKKILILKFGKKKKGNNFHLLCCV